MPFRRIALCALLLLVACGTPRRTEDDENCTPDCSGRACGDDGCGGTCGSCSGATPRCANHVCKAACTPQCEGKQCGDDGCDGTCGTCINAMTCTVRSLCAAASDGCSKGCPAGDYCDTASNSCRAGCLDDTNCAAGTSCDLHTHVCVPKPELCNGLDDDHDGQTDEDFPQKDQPCDGNDADRCANGRYACASDGHGVVCQGDTAKQELCNGLDDDCDGQTDEDFPQKGEKCDGNDADTCANGTWSCSADGRSLTCDGDVQKVEICNGVDDDCDGKTDTATSVTTLNLPGATSIQAAEWANGTLTILARTDAGAAVFSGAPASLRPTDALSASYLQDGTIENGVAAALFTNTAGSIWWGRPGAMHDVALPTGFTLSGMTRDMGGVVGLVDGNPVALRVAEFGSNVERIGIRWDGSTFVTTSLYHHAYSGGNLDNGGIVGLGSGKAVAFVRDEWSNNYQRLDVRCDWFSLAGGAWTAGDADSLCDPVTNVVSLGSTAYAVSEPWGQNPDKLRSASSSGREQSASALPSPMNTGRISLASDGKGRAHLIWMDPSTRAMEQRVVAGGTSTTSGLGVTLGQNGLSYGFASGDDVFVISYDQTTWGGPLSNVKLTRQLVCR